MASTTTSNIGSDTAAAAESAVDRAVQGAHSVVDRVAEKAGPAVDRLRTGLNSAQEAFETGVDDLDEMQERWIENCRTTVRDHPIAAIGVAVAAGVVLSRLMAR